MAEVAALNMLPITGIRPNMLDTAVVTPAGIVDDRRFVLYDPDTQVRISNKQLPGLLGFSASYDKRDNLRVLHGSAGELVIPEQLDETKGPFSIDEFGVSTPVRDAGDAAAAYFSDTLGTDVRLARKPDYWMGGCGTPPEDRTNAPLHIVFESTVDALQTDKVPFGAARFRANMVIKDTEPLQELLSIGKTIRVGGAVIAITRATERCPVPGFDPATGHNLKDVPTLYKQFPRAPGGKKPTMGVYGYLLPGEHNKEAVVTVGNRVTM